MPRNLDRRVEIAFPVLDPDLQARIRQILEVQLADTVKARRILADGEAPSASERSPAVRSDRRSASTRSRARRWRKRRPRSEFFDGWTNVQ